MENSDENVPSSQAYKAKGKAKAKGKFKGPCRRTWSKFEEVALLHALKELVTNGWKADNGFRYGYLGQLEAMMAKEFPDAHITGNKHINSKLTVWKNVYGQVCGMKNTSGFGWDEEKLMILVDSDEVWNTYVLSHGELSTYRTKSFPYFNHKVEIFENDRANGKSSIFYTNAIFNLENPHNQDYGPSAKRSSQKHPFDLSDDSDGDSVKIHAKESNNNAAGVSNDKGKRRKSTDSDAQGPMVDMLGSFLRDANSTLKELATSITAGQNMGCTKSTRVWETLDLMEDMLTKHKVLIYTQICKEPQKIDMFLGLTTEAQHEFIQLILTNTV